MSELNKTVAEKYKSLFKGYCFNFEGLKERTKEGFVKLVKEMGAKVSEDAQFIFVEQSYFQKKKNHTKDNYYDINYIMEAVQSIDPSNFLNHKLIPSHNNQVPNDEPMCYTARYVFKTDSCHKCYYEKVFCKECAKSNEEPQKDTNRHTKAIAAHSNAIDFCSESEDEIPKTSKKQVEKNKSDSSKRLISSESEDHSSDEEQSKSVNGKSKSPPRKKLKNSNETLNECESLETAIENNESRSDTDSLNNSGKQGNGKSTKNKSKETSSPIKQRAVTSNSDASSIEEDEDSGDTSVNQNKKQPQKIGIKRSEWIIPSKTKIPPPRKEKPVELSDNDSDDGALGTDAEDESYFRKKKWWIPYDIPEAVKCTYSNCTYEPDFHPTHYRPRKFLSSIEKKIILKYLINNNAIENAKGKTVYENMIRDGYLSHRSWETLRNCFRRTILKEIQTYNLEKNILNRFFALQDKSLELVKRVK